MSTASVHMVAPSDLPALPDDNARQFGGSNTPMHGIPRFEVVAVKMADGSYNHVEFVDIMIPGDNKTMPRHKVTDHVRNKYRAHYDHWKRSQEMAPTGTPIEMWSILTPSQVHELKARNIFTVEQLRDLSDSNTNNIPMGQTFRAQARSYLKEKQSADEIENRRRETQSMQDGMRFLEQQVRDMAAQLAEAKNAQIEAVQAAPPEPDMKPATNDIEAKRARMAKAREALAAKKQAQEA